MSSLASYPKGNSNPVGKDGSKEEKSSFPRSSSPSRAVDDEDVIEWKKEGMTTRSAKRKAVAEQPTVKEKFGMKQWMEDYMHNSEANDEQRLTRYGKRIRLNNVAKHLSKSYSSRRATSADNAVHQDLERFDLIRSDQLLSDRISNAEDEIYHVYTRTNSKSRAKRISNRYYHPSIFMIGGDELEKVCNYLDTKSAVNLLLSCKEINQKLTSCSGFWHQLCKNENFHEYSALKLEEPNLEESDADVAEASTNITTQRDKVTHSVAMRGKRRVTFKDSNEKRNEIMKCDKRISKEYKERMSWSGEKFHDVKFPSDAAHWRKIYLRGLQMRRNICNGRFELWRLFLTDENHLPVKKMTSQTTFRELRSEHRGSKFNRAERRVRIHRYWNEEYFIAIQQGFGEVEGFHDVFVWKWEECQKPRFFYSYSFQQEYPSGLFPTAFFLWQSYLVLMPETRISRESQSLRSMIRVHDLSSEKRMELVGSYDFPDSSPMRRFVPGMEATGSGSNETAHLHKLGDFAVALCRTPLHTVLIFNLPHCELVHQVRLCELTTIERPFEEDDLDQRFLMRNNTMMFMFHHPNFFDLDEGNFYNEDHDIDIPPKYGRLVFVDFTSFLSSQTKDKKNKQSSNYKRRSSKNSYVNVKNQNNPLISMKVDPQFDSNRDYIEKISVISKDRMVCVMQHGNIVIRDIMPTESTNFLCSHNDKLSIPCPDDLKLTNENGIFDTSDDDEDIDGPTLCTSRDGDVVMVMRHFKTGRYIHAYETINEGRLLYEINIDADSRYKLTNIPGYVSVDMDGNFVCAADLEKIVVWNSKNGKLIRVIPIVPHYNSREDPLEVQDRFCWKGHTDFAFAEDGIIIVHSQRNFPVAADIILFW